MKNCTELENQQIARTKEESQKALLVLKLRMPEIKLGECYEIFSQIEGYKN